MDHIGKILVVIATILLVVGVIWTYLVQSGQGDSSPNSFLPRDAISLYTLLLVFVSILQIVVLVRTDSTAGRAADAASEAAEASIKAAQVQESQLKLQRAFVFIDLFEQHALPTKFIVIPRWKNSGTTPTRYMTNWVNWAPFDGRPPDDFDFPDLDSTGNRVANDHQSRIQSFVGPQSTTYAQPLAISPEAFAAAREGKKTILVWGWARYEDMFGSKHVTKFCNEVKIDFVSEAGGKFANGISFLVYPRHNCTDE